MSRSGYDDDCYGWQLIMWRGAVASAIRGQRGQQLLRDLRDALDAMAEKKLVAHELVTPTGEVCALGAVALKRGLDVSAIDPDDYGQVADTFGIAQALAREIEDMNDDWQETTEQRWTRMRAWVESKIKATP